MQREENDTDLDHVADRLGNLYQEIGRAEFAADATQTKLLDEVLSLTEEVERISRRDERA